MTQHQSLLDLRPFQLSVPVPPMLAEACGYTGGVFGQPLTARYVGFYWQMSGDEEEFDDGRSSGTGEYTGLLAFVGHPKVAVHLRDCDFGSSETSPRHYLLLDRTEHRLYVLPVRLAQQFLHLQWSDQTAIGTSQPVASIEDLTAALNLAAWREVKLPADFQAHVMAAMQRQGRLVNDLVAWLDGQQQPMTAERMAEYEPQAPAMLLRHMMGTGPGTFAQEGSLVHIHEVTKSGDQVTITFYRDNGIDGPDTSCPFSLCGTWGSISETLEPLLEPSQLDDLLESEAELAAVIGRYAAWNGQAFPIVAMGETLAIRVTLLCARCGSNPTMAFARSGLHRGAFCYVYDGLGNYQANLRDREYRCSRCEKSRAETSTQESEDAGL